MFLNTSVFFRSLVTSFSLIVSWHHVQASGLTFSPTPYYNPLPVSVVHLLSSDGSFLSSGVVLEVEKWGKTSSKIVSISIEKDICSSFKGGVLQTGEERFTFALQMEPLSIEGSSYTLCLMDLPDDGLPVVPARPPTPVDMFEAMEFPSIVVTLISLANGFYEEAFRCTVEVTTDGTSLLKNINTTDLIASWTKRDEVDSTIGLSPYAPLLSLDGHFLGFAVDTKYEPPGRGSRPATFPSTKVEKDRIEIFSYKDLADALLKEDCTVSPFVVVPEKPPKKQPSALNGVITHIVDGLKSILHSDPVLSQTKKHIVDISRSSLVELFTENKSVSTMAVVVGEDLTSNHMGYYLLTVAPYHSPETFDLFTLVQKTGVGSRRKSLGDSQTSIIQSKVKFLTHLGLFSLYFMEPAEGFLLRPVEVAKADKIFSPFKTITLSFVNPLAETSPKTELISDVEVLTTLCPYRWFAMDNLKKLNRGYPFFDPETGALVGLFSKTPAPSAQPLLFGEQRVIPLTERVVSQMESVMRWYTHGDLD